MKTYRALEHEVRSALSETVATKTGTFFTKQQLRFLIVPMMALEMQKAVDQEDFDRLQYEQDSAGNTMCYVTWKNGFRLQSPLGARGDLVGFKEEIEDIYNFGNMISGWHYMADLTPVKPQRKKDAERFATWAEENYSQARACPHAAIRIYRQIDSVNAMRLKDITAEVAAETGLACLTSDGSTFRYGLADADGRPDKETAWAWSEWETDPRRALAKVLKQRYHNIDQTGDLAVWLYSLEPAAKGMPAKIRAVQ